MLLRDHPNAVICFGRTYQILYRGRVMPIAFTDEAEAHRKLAGLLSFGGRAEAPATQVEAA